MEPINRQPNNSPESKRNWFSKHIIAKYVFLLVVFGLVILFSLYQWQLIEISNHEENTQQVSKTDVTAGWNTYTDEQYGFEIKYPKSWYLWEIPFYDDSGHAIGSSTSEFRFSYAGTALFIDPLSYYSGPNPNNLAEEKMVTIGNVRVRRREFRITEGIYLVDIGPMSNSRYPAFHLYMSGLNAKEYLTPEEISRLESVLSTFKFTR